MKRLVKYTAIAFLSAIFLAGCHERYVTYSDAEYVMFADTLATYPVQQDVDYIKVPVVSTVTRDYDRTFGVEVIDKGSNAIVDSIGFTLSLIMADQLEMPLYGRQTKVVLMKSCPFDINDYTGYCMLSSMFLYQYGITGSYQRLIYTEKHPTEENMIICRNWIADGYDITMRFHAEDPMAPVVTMDSDQVMSDEGSFFGQTHGDDKILVESSPYYESYFYPCGRYLYLYTHVYVENLGTPVGTVGHFYNVMEWISDEEADQLRKEGL